VTIGLSCVTSFFIGNLSNKLTEELEVHVCNLTTRYHRPIVGRSVAHHITAQPQPQHQAEERRRKKKEELEWTKAQGLGLDPLRDTTIRFKVERRVSSDDLMLTDVSE
jgi:hypothetical protein